MDLNILAKSALFSGMSAADLRAALRETSHYIQNYEKDEFIFRLMEPANRIGIILRGHVEAQKFFPNGSQINVSVRGQGDLIGPAAVFSKNQLYPCNMVALEPVTIMMFRRDDLTTLMQKNIKILENLMTEIASSTYLLQQRLELLSYSGIAQKAAFYLLMQARQTGKNPVRIPGSVTKWAMQMNVSRSSLHRELKKMENAGIIAYAPPFITILNADNLQDILSR